MSTQKGNVKKSGPPKHQNKKAWKNVYHDTSKRTHLIVNTEVSGVCQRCKDIIDWKIKYRKYKPLTQPKTCASCKEKTVKKAYNVYCLPCSSKQQKCAKCGEKKEVVLKPSLAPSEQASEDTQLKNMLEQLPERKRRTILRKHEKGELDLSALAGDDDEDFDSDNDSCVDSDADSVEDNTVNDRDSVKRNISEPGKGLDSEPRELDEKDILQLDLNKD